MIREALRGMGPDGRWLTGAAYLLYQIQIILDTERGTHPMRADLGSDLHRRLGEPTNAEFSGRLTVSIAQAFRQITAPGYHLTRVETSTDGQQVTATLHLEHEGQVIALAPLRVG